MRTSESVPSPIRLPRTGQCHRHDSLRSAPEAILLTRAAADLMDWIECGWIVGLVCSGPGLRVACAFGTPPDLARCIQCVSDTLRRAGDALCLETDADCGEHEGALPVMIARLPGLNGVAPLFAIGPKNGNCAYSARDRELIRDLGISIGALLSKPQLLAALALEFSESVKRQADFESAVELQDRFLPQAPASIPGLEYHGRSQRCGALGGDFLGFLRADAKLAMTIGRVGSTGLPAALMAAGIQGALRSLLLYEPDLSRILQELNRMVWDVSPGDVFGTLLCARIDPSSATVEYVSAGEQAAYLIQAGGRMTPLGAPGAVLGLSRRSIYVKRTAVFEPGDVMVAITDGIADATSSGERHFIRALPRLLAQLARAAAREITGGVLEAVEFFTGLHAGSADRSVAAIRMSEVQRCRVRAVAA